MERRRSHPPEFFPSLLAHPGLIGRHQELSSLLERIENTRLTGLVGPPRMGKTSLVLELLAHPELEGRTGGPAFYLSLRGVRSARAMLVGLSGLLGKWLGESRSPGQDLARHRGLLVLDHCEEPQGAFRGAFRSFVREVLEDAPEMKVLLVSRPGPKEEESLTDAAAMELGPLTGTESRELWMQRSGELPRGEAELLLELCGGNPGLLRWMVPLAEEFSAKQLLQVFEPDLESLESEEPDAKKKASALNQVASMAISAVQQLDRDAAQLLSVLSFLPGGALASTVQALAGPEWQRPLGRLVARGLLEPLSGWGQKRLVCPPEITALAQMTLPPSARRDASRQLAAFYAHQAKGILQDWARGDAWTSELELCSEEANFLGCFLPERLDFKEESKEVVGAPVLMAESLVRLLLRQKRPADALVLLTQSLDWAQNAGLPRGQAQVLRELSRVHAQLGDDESAAESMDQALAIYQHLEDLSGQARLLQEFALLRARSGNVQSAMRDATQALELEKARGNLQRQGEVRQTLAWVLLRSGQVTQAESVLQRALELQEEGVDLKGQAATLVELGRMAQHQDNLQAALDFFTRASQLYVQLQDPLGQANSLKAAGDLELRVSHHELARELLHQAMELFQSIQAPVGAANVLQSLARLEWATGEHNRANQLLLEAFDAHLQCRDPLGAAADLGYLTRLAKENNHFHQALAWSEMALSAHRMVGDALGAALDLENQAECLEPLGKPEGALAARWMARELYHQIESNAAERLEQFFEKLSSQSPAPWLGQFLDNLEVNPEGLRRTDIEPLLLAVRDRSPLKEVANKLGFIWPKDSTGAEAAKKN